ncbi:hypothetical protein GUITHDRAFT_110211 [Guillardia theta CCMP2712]|uniref:TrmE-type G domain-containing protein n=1 Tax=Guillardia theta (strain CCMP2712) TaxID=905079 RepID=L1J6N0_GUITC|nr:hypothetical protein GUITHDRAFT_110211 [Guillardia theta CCMP2712]EKX43754.1 hypothetical protein GUITHDRAFT_110211 [Guillardia theta CCMP2712]|eukprot:XP_005830734.1 hypothetical protein GUITHDRAFT_110211 [Guillardia theta CCMP2712]
MNRKISLKASWGAAFLASLSSFVLYADAFSLVNPGISLTARRDFTKKSCRPFHRYRNLNCLRRPCSIALSSCAVSDEVDSKEVYFPKTANTIYALSTPVGVGGIAVIRISGEDALPALQEMSKPGNKKSRELLDKSLILFFPGPNSFTGEDVVELHVHGGVAIVNSVLDALSKIEGLRLAQRGEYTRRALMNGRMDLLEAEALSDLINAETKGQQKQALEQPRQDVGRIYDEVNTHLADGRRGEAIRTGLRCTLVGPPNAGKSSLLNVLAARPAAIVSSIPGTTRDIVQVRLELGGLPVMVDDTAGLRVDSSDEIEREGMRRSAMSFKQADIRILVLDGGESTTLIHKSAGNQMMAEDSVSLLQLLNEMYKEFKTELEGDSKFDVGKTTVGNWGWSRKAKELIEEEEEEEGVGEGKLLVVLNKVDLIKKAERKDGWRQELTEEIMSRLHKLTGSEIEVHWISCTTREGIDEFIDALNSKVEETTMSEDEAPLITRARHRELLSSCAETLERFLETQVPVGFAVEDLTEALDLIGQITGEVNVEEVLDVVFRDFCIGK